MVTDNASLSRVSPSRLHIGSLWQIDNKQTVISVPKDYAVVKTVLLTTVREPTLDAILPSLLHIEQELNSEEAEPIYMAKADRQQP